MAVGAMGHLRGATKCAPLVTTPGPTGGSGPIGRAPYRIAAAGLCGWAPQCTEGNSTSDSLSFSLCSFGGCGGSWCVETQRPCPSSGRATVQSAGTPPPHTYRAQGNQERVRDGDRGNSRVEETRRKRVGATERGRSRARGWHTRVTTRLRRGGRTYRQGRLREGEWEGRRASEGARGCGRGVAQRRAGGTRRARGSSGERKHGDTRKKNSRTGGHTGRTRRGGTAREVGGTGGQPGRKGTPCLSQRNTMPMTRVEPYRPPRPTIRELMEGRPAGEDDGGVPPKGCLGRPPRSPYRSKDRAEALRRVKAREIQRWRGDDQRRAHGAGEQI